MKYIFWEQIWEKLILEDIAKTIWKYITIETIKSRENFDNIKKTFYNLWYIWRGNNFFKFRTPIEMQIIYSKTKIVWIEKILDKEIKVLWDNLKCAIITDFLDENESNFLIVKSMTKKLDLILFTALTSSFWI